MPQGALIATANTTWSGNIVLSGSVGLTAGAIPLLSSANSGALIGAASTITLTITGVVSEATLALPTNDWMQQGGRSGRHSEHLGHLLSELQSMQRTFPEATW